VAPANSTSTRRRFPRNRLSLRLCAGIRPGRSLADVVMGIAARIWNSFRIKVGMHLVVTLLTALNLIQFKWELSPLWNRHSG